MKLLKLVLGRKVGQAIMIGDDARIVVKSIKGKNVTLAIEAPLDTRVDRHEVWLRKYAEEHAIEHTPLKPQTTTEALSEMDQWQREASSYDG